ncbi:MAG: AzlD domain-containing protein [Anaerosomatales bacterium]
MSERESFWFVILALAGGTFLLRSLPLWLHGRTPAPRWLERLLRHVPAAALTALVVPASLYTTSNGTYEVAPARIVAAVAALLVAAKTRNVIWTLVTGMAVLWVTQGVLGTLGL